MTPGPSKGSGTDELFISVHRIDQCILLRKAKTQMKQPTVSAKWPGMPVFYLKNVFLIFYFTMYDYLLWNI